MNKNEKRVLIFVVVIFFSLAINMVYTQLNSIDEITFFEHHIELDEAFHRNNIELRYITNIDDDRKVNYLDFYIDDINGGEVSNHRMKTVFHFEENYNSYKIVTLNMSFEQYFTVEEKIILENPRVYFDNGDTAICDIGKLYISHKEENSNVERIMVSSSSDGTARSVIRFEEPVEILDIRTELDSILKDDLRLSLDLSYIGEIEYKTREIIDYKKIDDFVFPISVEDILVINSKFSNFDKKLILKPIIQLKVRSLNGEISIVNIYNIGENVEFTNKMIKEVVESRGN